MQQERLESILEVPIGSCTSLFDQLRTGPVMVSCLSLVQALRRLHSVRELGIKLPAVTSIPAIRIAALARFAGTAKVSAILRLQNPRRLATLVAFMQCLEATAQDDALEVLELLLRELFGRVEQTGGWNNQHSFRESTATKYLFNIINGKWF